MMNIGKTVKRIASFLLTLILVTCVVSGPVSVKAAGTVSLSASNATASAGSDVVISINISADSGLAAADIFIKYDTAKLTYTNSVTGPAALGGMSSVNANYAVEGNFNTIKDAFIHVTGISTGGSLLNITFTVKTGWTGSTPITLTTGDFVNAIFNEIPKTVTNGSVTAANGQFVAITDSEGTELGPVLPVRLGVFGFYRDKSLKLGFETNLTGAAIKWKSSNNKIVLVGESTGIITNKGILARSADITITLTQGSTVVTDTVRVVFYKYDWQLDYFVR